MPRGRSPDVEFHRSHVLPAAARSVPFAGVRGGSPAFRRLRGPLAVGRELAVTRAPCADAAAAVDHGRRRVAAAFAAGPLARGWPALAAPAAPDDGSAHTGRWVHAFSAYGAPKYGPGFTHFDYVNPDAPKRGTLTLRNPDRRTSFDKLNPWTVRGSAPAGIALWMVESLTHAAQDEPQTVYGLLAESMYVEADFSAATFRLRPEARFSNGEPVTADDVVHSFAMLTGKGASPSVQTQLAGVAAALALNAATVRFEMRERSRDAIFAAAGLPVFWRRWGDGKPFDQIVAEPPVTSGPYVIESFAFPNRIAYRRDPSYWGRGLAVRRGHFNFDRIVYRFYLDASIAFEAFKAGEFDLYKEYGARSWVRRHAGKRWDEGRIRKQRFTTDFGQGLQSFQLNLRRPIFEDIRVREALGWTYDFDTLNKAKLLTRAASVFNNSPFAARGLPSPGELALLAPFRSELPPRVFGPAFVPPRTGGDPDALRSNLLQARGLFEQAGWKLAPDQVLRNSRGDAFEIEYLSPQDGRVDDWQRNLAKLGVRLKTRVVDFALYRRRLEKYDFDMVTIVEGDFTLPPAADLEALYGSKSADEEGNANYRGVRSRAADALIEAIAAARTLGELTDAARAFDRVAMWSFWQVPDLYSNTENISFWNRFGIPRVQARFFAAETGQPWPLWCWWDESQPAVAG